MDKGKLNILSQSTKEVLPNALKIVTFSSIKPCYEGSEMVYMEKFLSYLGNLSKSLETRSNS